MKKNMKRKRYALTPVEMTNLLKASNPPPFRPIPGAPPPLDAQERANIAWAHLGQVHGFYPETVRAIPGESPFNFTAVPVKGDGDIVDAETMNDVEFVDIKEGKSGTD